VKIVALIPVYNEEGRIKDVIAKVDKHVDKILVLNDCSSDNSEEVARKTGVEVLTKSKNLGYLRNLLNGIEKTEADVFITIDADGEHPPERIPDLLKQIRKGEADLVLGRRKKVPRVSERIISYITWLKTGIQDK
jgi:glycosyltransferase involved in cell wall biosynthesis